MRQEEQRVSMDAITQATPVNTLEPRLGRSVSIDQAAVLLSVSRRTIYNRIREGRLQTIRTIGGSQRVLVESLHDLGFRPQAFPASAATVIVNGTRDEVAAIAARHGLRVRRTLTSGATLDVPAGKLDEVASDP